MQPGEALGIIGPNGAGKSTTLKLLTRILKPTRGRCSVHGRVGALIEVAAGFHPDLTGRENVFLQGAIMGMRRADIARKFDEIVEFAGIAEFIDTPVKRYSRGMNARLGFSIAAHLDPDVLIIDEVLGVGDLAFQARCVESMRAFKERGATIVFVSHNLQAVSDLCDRTLFIKREVQALGETSEVIRKYVQAVSSQEELHDWISVLGAAFVGQGPSVNVSPGERLTLRVTYEAHKPASDLTFGLIMHRSTDLMVVASASVTDQSLAMGAVEAAKRFAVDFHFSANLVRGQSHADCLAYHNPTQQVLGRLNPAGLFGSPESRRTLVWPTFSWKPRSRPQARDRGALREIAIYGAYKNGNFGDDLMGHLIAERLSQAGYLPRLWMGPRNRFRGHTWRIYSDMRSFVSGAACVFSAAAWSSGIPDSFPTGRASTTWWMPARPNGFQSSRYRSGAMATTRIESGRPEARCIPDVCCGERPPGDRCRMAAWPGQEGGVLAGHCPDSPAVQGADQHPARGHVHQGAFAGEDSAGLGRPALGSARPRSPHVESIPR